MQITQKQYEEFKKCAMGAHAKVQIVVNPEPYYGMGATINDEYVYVYDVTFAETLQKFKVAIEKEQNNKLKRIEKLEKELEKLKCQ